MSEHRTSIHIEELNDWALQGGALEIGNGLVIKDVPFTKPQIDLVESALGAVLVQANYGIVDTARPIATPIANSIDSAFTKARIGASYARLFDIDVETTDLEGATGLNAQYWTRSNAVPKLFGVSYLYELSKTSTPANPRLSRKFIKHEVRDKPLVQPDSGMPIDKAVPRSDMLNAVYGRSIRTRY